MQFKVTTGTNTASKANIKYPVLCKYKQDGDIYMFMNATTALIIKHKDADFVGTYSDTMLPVTDDNWEILPDGFTIELTQDQG